MKRAIVLPYAVYQNEPSIPKSTLVEFPDNKDEQVSFLHSLFREFNYSEDEHGNDDTLDGVTIEYGDDVKYGDVAVGNDDAVVYLTFVED